jgi:biopolymer transport protein ExbD
MVFSAQPVADSKRDINVVPLIDVMLVLLIIFMVTAPVVTREIPLDLPQPAPVVTPTVDREPIRLRIDADGAIHWAGRPLPAAALAASLQIETLARSAEDQPRLEIDASPEAPYAAVTAVLAVANDVGVAKIGFVGGAR